MHKMDKEKTIENIKKILSYLEPQETYDKVYFISQQLHMKYVPKSNSTDIMYLDLSTGKVTIESGFEDYHKNEPKFTHFVTLVDEDDIELAYSKVYKDSMSEFRGYCESKVLEELTNKKILDLLQII